MHTKKQEEYASDFIKYKARQRTQSIAKAMFDVTIAACELNGIDSITANKMACDASSLILKK